MAVGIAGIRGYGYMGQDFVTHSSLVRSYPSGFSYALTNPPGLYWFGSLVLGAVGREHYLEAIALSFLLMNSAALWVLYGFLWKGISERPLRYAAAAFATLVPFRVIHSVVLASDALTFPIFALAALFALLLYENPRSTVSWAGLALSLTAGMFCKYTFVGLLPPVALLLAAAIARRLTGASRLRWGAVGVLALALLTAAFLLQIRETRRLKGDVATGQWLPAGAPAVMRWSDILLPQRSDLGLFRAPGYLSGKLYGFRNFSYMGLLHVASFCDVLDIFQAPAGSVPQDWGHRTQVPFARRRTAASQALQEASVRMGLAFSILALVGTVACGVLGALSLLTGRPRIEDSTLVITALAAGFYSTIFFSLNRLGDPYTPGFWLPRLVLPALLVFFCLGFVSLDLAFRRPGASGGWKGPVLWTAFSYTAAACLVFAGFLA
ncbi:MAG TPA: glycosyltransferase family 39 protein [Opitutaceae bacterium]